MAQLTQALDGTAATPPCPLCGGELQIEPKGIISEPMPGFWHYGAEARRMEREAHLGTALCGSCEFCIEIK